jgi:hypothetical protein
MKLLELFAGSRSIGKRAELRGIEVFSTDIVDFGGIDLVKDIRDILPKDIPFIPDVIWASPPCTYFSVASIGKHWTPDHQPKTEQALFGVRIVSITKWWFNFYSYYNPNLIWFMENPRGKLRKLPIVDGMPRHTVCYCKYGDTRMKPTDIWTNSTTWKPREMCYNGNRNCHHEPAPRGSKTGTQGLKDAYTKSMIPEQLADEILDSLI